jgi:hypothetical protein
VGPHAVTINLGPRALGQTLPRLIASHGMVRDSHHPFLRVRDPWGGASRSGGEGLSPRALESIQRGFYPCQRELSYRGGDHAGSAC